MAVSFIFHKMPKKLINNNLSRMVFTREWREYYELIGGKENV